MSIINSHDTKKYTKKRNVGIILFANKNHYHLIQRSLTIFKVKLYNKKQSKAQFYFCEMFVRTFICFIICLMFIKLKLFCSLFHLKIWLFSFFLFLFWNRTKKNIFKSKKISVEGKSFPIFVHFIIWNNFHKKLHHDVLRIKLKIMLCKQFSWTK